MVYQRYVTPNLFLPMLRPFTGRWEREHPIGKHTIYGVLQLPGEFYQGAMKQGEGERQQSAEEAQPSAAASPSASGVLTLTKNVLLLLL